jgi:hypothetical protein
MDSAPFELVLTFRQMPSHTRTSCGEAFIVEVVLPRAADGHDATSGIARTSARPGSAPAHSPARGNPPGCFRW